MPWVRFDDQFPIHRKAAGLTDAAFRLHVSAIFWCARNLTDGFVPEEDLDDVCARVRTPQRFAAECVRRGAWHDAGEHCDSPKCPGPVDKPGWVIHDYLEYQFSKEQVIRDREASARRQQKWRESRKGAGQTGNAVSNARSNAVSNAPVTLPRPAPKGSGAGNRRPEPAANGRASPPGSPARGEQPKPPWCGECDERTRMLTNLETGDVTRCPRCNSSASLNGAGPAIPARGTP